MKHNLLISVSNKPENKAVVTCKKITVREKLMRFFLGDLRKVTILVPGDSVEQLSINEISGGDNYETVRS